MAPLPDSLLAILPRQLQPRNSLTIASDISGSALSPLDIQDLHRRSDNTVSSGSGSKPFDDFNNQGFLALFAIIGASMVLATIWFFFWAKNGGFKWRRGDWDDYKSTVLRRKGPDGKTLSNATRSTKLGGGSVVHGGSYGHGDRSSVGYTDSTGYTDKDEMREVDLGNGIRGGDGRTHRSQRNGRSRDPELADYRQEKAARVGGLNRQHDGSYFDYSNTEPSEVSRAKTDRKSDKKERARLDKERKQNEKTAAKEAAANEKKAKEEAKAAQKAEAAQRKKDAAEKKKQAKGAKSEVSGPTKPAAVVLAEPSNQVRPPPSAAYTYTNVNDDDQTVYSGGYTATYSEYTPSQPSQASYYDAYRPKNARSANAGSRSGRSSPRKPRIVQPSGEWNSQAASQVGSQVESDTGTKSYPCYIPGLSSAPSVGVSESVSQVGGRKERERERSRRDGYRRGGRNRRDSLSDSDRE